MTAVKPGGRGPNSTQCATDVYAIVRIKIAVLAIVAFANAGIKQLYTTGYKLQICSEDTDESINAKSSVISFLSTYTTFLRGRSHILYMWGFT